VIDRSLARRATAEALGSAFLVAIVVGSGISAQRLSPNDVGLQLLENSTATGVGLVALILAFGPVSGAHFNPVITLADWLLGGITATAGAVYVVAQVVGCCVGAIVANLMFELDAVNLSMHTRSSHGLWLGEFVATLGLVFVVFGIVRSGRAALAPFAVGGYIAAAYWFTSSTSFANPAVTLARTLSNTFAGIRPSSVPAFVAVQIAAALCAVALVKFLHPDIAAVDVVVPHEPAAATPESTRS
jgi:glycerol uptake facilitator-like aquaporin